MNQALTQIQQRFIRALFISFLSFLSGCNSAQSEKGTEASKSPAHTLKPVGSLDLPGEKGQRFDYLTIDYKDNYLLSAHLGTGILYVIDLKKDKLVKAIPGVPGVEGVEYVPEFNEVYTSDWKDKTIGIVDLNQMKVIKKLPALNKPDGSAYAKDFKKLYVSDERAKSLLVIDVVTKEIIKTLHFNSETGMPQYDSLSKKLYLNLQDENNFVVIDPSKDSITARYPVGEGKGNHGMALDIPNRRAFLACEENNLLVVLDLNTFKPITALKLADGCDVVKFDPGLKRIYVACYSGNISVFKEDDPSHFSKLEDFQVQEKVHSLEVDRNTHRVYAPEQQENGKPVSRMIIYEAIY